MIYEKCREILLKEYELVQRACAVQKKIEEAVNSREWAGFDGYFDILNTLKREMSEQENEREALFAEFEKAPGQGNFHEKTDEKGRFYAMASRLPPDQRNDLTSIYRSLKIEALKLRMAGEAYQIYLAGAKASLADFFELAFPDRGGKMYTQDGTRFSHDMRSMVLNRRF